MMYHPLREMVAIITTTATPWVAPAIPVLVPTSSASQRLSYMSVVSYLR
jgi:hypothetical protein